MQPVGQGLELGLGWHPVHAALAQHAAATAGANLAAPASAIPTAALVATRRPMNDRRDKGRLIRCVIRRVSSSAMRSIFVPFVVFEVNRQSARSVVTCKHSLLSLPRLRTLLGVR